jgi:hypothetical protein
MNFTNELDFLGSFWKEAQRITGNISTELPKINPKAKMIGKHLAVVQYKDLENWSVEGLFGKSENLDALARKISFMVNKGDAQNVKPLIERILTKGVKAQTKPKLVRTGYTCDAEFYGFGHFRWDYKAYILKADELKRVREYFNM